MIDRYSRWIEIDKDIHRQIDRQIDKKSVKESEKERERESDVDVVADAFVVSSSVAFVAFAAPIWCCWSC